MLANSWASAGGTLTSRRTRSAADARSAARSWAIVTRDDEGKDEDEDEAETEGEGDAEADPGGSTRLA